MAIATRTDLAFPIAGKWIGTGHGPFIIAEMSGNHNGDIARAYAIADAAKAAGADALKMQSYTADTITIKSDSPDFMIDSGPWAGRTLHDLYESAHTPWNWHPQLFEYCKKIGLTLFSTPFDSSAVALLASLDAPAYKIASFEIVDLPLIRLAAAQGRPLILSTGAASLQEISEALAAVRETGLKEVVVLHCTSGYPTPVAESQLATMESLANRFDVLVGLSDHTLGTVVPVAAVALGAAVIEKHLTLSRAEGGPDAAFSLEPDEFKNMVDACRLAYSAIGKPRTEISPSERDTYKYRRSIYVVADIPENGLLTELNVRSIRPGLGLPPKLMPEILGARATRALRRGTALSLGDYVRMQNS